MKSRREETVRHSGTSSVRLRTPTWLCKSANETLQTVELWEKTETRGCSGTALCLEEAASDPSAGRPSAPLMLCPWPMRVAIVNTIIIISILLTIQYHLYFFTIIVIVTIVILLLVLLQ